MEVLNNLFGVGEHLTSGQMALRAFVLFFVALVLIRISGMRSFGSKSALDNIIVIMLGAILSRAVVGATALVPTICAGISLCVTHRLLAMLAARFHVISFLLKGKDRLLYKEGKLYKDNLMKADISEGDLDEGIRLAGNASSLDKVKEVRMERSGQISVVKE